MYFLPKEKKSKNQTKLWKCNNVINIDKIRTAGSTVQQRGKWRCSGAKASKPDLNYPSQLSLQKRVKILYINPACHHVMLTTVLAAI